MVKLDRILLAEQAVQKCERLLSEKKGQHKAAKEAFDLSVTELRRIVRDVEQPQLEFNQTPGEVTGEAPGGMSVGPDGILGQSPEDGPPQEGDPLPGVPPPETPPEDGPPKDEDETEDPE